MSSAAEATTVPRNVAAHRVPTDRLRMAVSGEPGTLVGQAQHSEHIVDGQIGTTDLATNAVTPNKIAAGSVGATQRAEVRQLSRMTTSPISKMRMKMLRKLPRQRGECRGR